MDINYLALIVAAIASMVIGSLWYGPLFGKAFMRAMGMDKPSGGEQAEMAKGMMISYAVQFVASLVMFYVLAMFMGDLGQLTVSGGMMVGFWAWLGFVVPVKLADALWGGKMILFWIGASNMLLTLLVAGAIIGAW